MTRKQKIGVVAVCTLVAVGSFVPAFLKAQTAVRDEAKIMADLQAAQDDVKKVMPSLILLSDAEFRAGDGQKAIAPLKKMAGLFDELEKVATDKDEKDVARVSKFHLLSYAGAMGDKETLAKLQEIGKGKDANAVSAKVALALDGWLGSTKNAAGQIEVLDEFAPVAKENPKNEEVMDILAAMANLGIANNDSAVKLIDVIRTNMDEDLAKSTLKHLEGMQELHAMVGKPLAVAGRTSTGGKFDVSQYKGKVVMIDFWATWCAPCVANLPEVKKVYAANHEKGFEIVGISNDDEDSVLNSFIKEQNMPWVQLRETSQSERDPWHPLAKKLQIEMAGIPTVFLLDRNGVLRYADRGEDLEKKVAGLLAEAAK